MKYNDTTTNQGIIQDADFIIGANNYSIADKTRSANKWYNRVVSLILSADGKWQWDDSNNGDYPIGSTDLESGVEDYNFNTLGVLKVLRVEVKDQNGNMKQMLPFDQGELQGMALSEFKKTPSTPQFYDLKADSVFLYPSPNYTSSGGLTIYYQRGPNYFDADDTIKEPGFASHYHEILSYGIAYDYCIAKNLSRKVPLIYEKIKELEQAIVEHYSSRDRDQKVRMSVRKENYGHSDDYYYNSDIRI